MRGKTTIRGDALVTKKGRARKTRTNCKTYASDRTTGRTQTPVQRSSATCPFPFCRFVARVSNAASISWKRNIASAAARAYVSWKCLSPIRAFDWGLTPLQLDWQRHHCNLQRQQTASKMWITASCVHTITYANFVMPQAAFVTATVNILLTPRQNSTQPTCQDFRNPLLSLYLYRLVYSLGRRERLLLRVIQAMRDHWTIIDMCEPTRVSLLTVA